MLPPPPPPPTPPPFQVIATSLVRHVYASLPLPAPSFTLFLFAPRIFFVLFLPLAFSPSAPFRLLVCFVFCSGFYVNMAFQDCPQTSSLLEPQRLAASLAPRSQCCVRASLYRRQNCSNVLGVVGLSHAGSRLFVTDHGDTVRHAIGSGQSEDGDLLVALLVLHLVTAWRAELGCTVPSV